MAVQGDVVYAACGDAGLDVLRIRPEGGFEKIGELAGHPTVFDVHVEGNRLYTAEGLDGWGVYELDGPAAFREVDRRRWLDEMKDPALCVWKPKPGIVVLSTRRSGVSLFDERDLNAANPLARTGGCPGWDKYCMDAAIGSGRWLAFNVANTSLHWFDLAAKPQPVVQASRVNRTSLSNGICRFDENRALLTLGTGYVFLKPGEGDPADGSKWRTKEFPGHAMHGIPRVSPEGLVALTCRIRRQIGLWDFKDPDHPRFLKHWNVSGNPDLAAFHKGRLLVPCGYQGVLLQKTQR